MAKFSKWVDWRTMARDLASGLYKLTVAENFAKTEFVFQDWTPRIQGSNSMTVSLTEGGNNRARYMVLGSVCFFEFGLTFTTAGVASTLVYVSCPKYYPKATTQYLYTGSDNGTEFSFRDVVFSQTLPPTLAALYPGGVFRCRGPSYGNWGIGSGRYVGGVGFYEIA